MHQKPHQQLGFAVLLTVLIMTSILLIALLASDMLQRSLAITKIAARSYPAYLAAEAGAERMLWEGRKNQTNFADGEVTFDPPMFASGNPSLQVLKAERTVGGFPYVIATSTGSYLDAQRSIVVQYQKYE